MKRLCAVRNVSDQALVEEASSNDARRASGETKDVGLNKANAMYEQ